MEKRRINVRAIVWHEGKLLAVKHKNDDGTPQRYWALPGGGLDSMESLEAGVKREVMEELGVEPEIGRLLGGQQFPSGREGFDEELELFFEVKYRPDFKVVDLAATSHGADELADIAFVDPRVVPIKPELLATLEIEALLTQDTFVEVVNNL